MSRLSVPFDRHWSRQRRLSTPSRQYCLIDRQSSSNDCGLGVKKRKVSNMSNKLAFITASVVSLFFMVLPATTYAQDCSGLRWACEHKDQLGLQGAGTCRRYRGQCGGGEGKCGQLRYACEHKGELGLQGAGSCRRFHETCG